MEISILKSLLGNLINEFIQLTNSISEYDSADIIKTATAAQSSDKKEKASRALRNIVLQNNRIAKLFFSSDEKKLLEAINFYELFNEKTSSSILTYSSNFSNPLEPTTRKQVKEIGTFISKISNAYQTLTLFNLETQEIHKTNESYIDIIFQNETELDSFLSARNEINDWYLIFYGYALLLDIAVEDFTILSIERNSPVKIKIRVDINTGKVIRSFSTALLLLAAGFINKGVLLSSLEKLNHDEILNKQKNEYIENARKQNEKELEYQIRELIEKTIKEKNIIGRGDIDKAMFKAAKKQCNFFIRGGNNNIYLNEASNAMDNEQSDESLYIEAKEKMNGAIGAAQGIKILPISTDTLEE